MKESGKILALTHEAIRDAIRPGISTSELDKIALNVIEKYGAKPSFLGYMGYPAVINASVNDEVIHGIPSEKRFLEEGDIIGIDIGCVKNGFHADAARTHPVGKISEKAQKLIRVTRECFFKGLEFCKLGYRVSDISSAIEKHALAHGYSLVKEFTGHGVGKSLHEEPHVPNYGKPGRGPRLEVGMTLAIEPMLNMGKDRVYMLDDDWTIVTADGKLSAHYENTVVITDGKPYITTLMTDEITEEFQELWSNEIRNR